MSDPGSASRKEALRLEDVARAASELAAEHELDSLLARFLDRVREWGAPSALLAAVRDPVAESGWRLLPALSFGSGPLGAERGLAKLIEDTPGCLERPTFLQPGEAAPGVQPRDNCIVPWAHEGDSGVLVLRGVPRPSAPNLGEALTVLATPLWPRLLGSPAARIESMVGELRRVAERLEEDARRHLERLKASAPPAAAEAGGEERVAAAQRASELEGQLELARREQRQAAAEQEQLRERLVALETALREAVGERDRAMSELKGLGRETDAEARARAAEEALGAARKELEAVRREGEHSTLEWDELKGRVAALQEALGEAEAERDGARDKAERLTARVESLQSEHATANEKVEEQRRADADRTRGAEETLASLKKELEAAREEVKRAAGETETLKERLVPVEEALGKAERERDEARANLARLEEERRSVGDTARSAEETLVTTQRELTTAREEEQQANAEAGALRALVASLEKTLKETEVERDGAREKAEALEKRKDSAETAARTAEEALASVREELAETKKAEATKAEAKKAEAKKAAEGGPAGDETEGKATALLRDTLGVLRRTPFVPPGLRVSMDEGRAIVGGTEEKRPEPWLRVALLDRDASSIEPLVEELEAEGLEVKIANYPEELALLMKTPDARKLDVAVCDVLAFRADQTVAGLFRGWEKDRPGLAFLLSFNNEDAAEAERAKRVPISLTAGRLPRPIPATELIEKLRVLAQKQTATEE
jgi:hypothetical protein